MIGRGIGRRMFEHAVERAKATRARWLVWSTDSNALGFYLRMGGEITGTEASAYIASHVPPGAFAVDESVVNPQSH